jgi:TonB family protein
MEGGSHGFFGKFEGMVVASLALHLFLAIVLMLHPEFNRYQKMSLPVMEVEMVSNPLPVAESEAKRALPENVPQVPRKVLKPTPPLSPKKTPPRKAAVEHPHAALPPVPDKTVDAAREYTVPAPAETVREKVPEPVVSVDTASYPLDDYYLRLIQSKVDRQWRQPVMGKQKRVVIRFVISRRGKVEGVAVEESSGDEYFDQTAVRAVRLSDPFPPLPPSYLGNSLQVHYRFRFGEDG